jgi:hypothetical protein
MAPQSSVPATAPEVDAGTASPEAVETNWPNKERIGVGECDEYVAKMKACFLALDAETRPAAEEGFSLFVSAWKKLAKSGPEGRERLRRDCRMMLDSMRPNCE